MGLVIKDDKVPKSLLQREEDRQEYKIENMGFLAEKIKPLLPVHVRQVVSNLTNQIRDNHKRLNSQITRWTGVLPDFLIIGGQKCGTTSLYNYLLQHSCVYPASKKEIGFFDRFPTKGVRWYRSHFPSLARKSFARLVRVKGNFRTGEASTGYILYPHALKRIKHTLPKVRLILILRNPVDRAYSHYQHTFRMGKETLSFEEAIEKESERVGGDWKHLLEDEFFFSSNIALYSYYSIGLYYDQVKVLFDIFPRKRVLIIRSEDLFNSPTEVLASVLEFLHLPMFNFTEFEKYNKGNYTKMDQGLRNNLINLYAPHNRKLYNLLNMNMSWDQ